MMQSSKKLKNLLLCKYDHNNEDMIGSYISSINILIRELSPNILNEISFTKSQIHTILEPLFHFIYHQDNMMRSVAKLCLLNVIKNCKGTISQEISSSLIPVFIKNIISFFCQTITKIKKLTISGRIQNLKAAYHRYEEEVEFIDDILNMKKANISDRIRTSLMVKIMLPLLQLIPNDKKFINSKMAFVLLGITLNSMNDCEFKEFVSDFFLSKEKNYVNNKENKYIKLNYKIIDTVTNFLANKKPRSLRQHLLWLLNSIANFYAKNRNERGVISLLETYGTYLFNILLSDLYSSSDTEIDMIVLFFIKIFKGKKYTERTMWENFRNCYKELLNQAYLIKCQQIILEIDSDLLSLIDSVNNNFICSQKELEYASFEILNLTDGINETKEIKDQKKLLVLNRLLRFRFLYNCVSLKKESILPLLHEKAKVGETLPLRNSIPCKKLIYKSGHSDVVYRYVNDHFLCLTNNHMAILQNIGKKPRSIVIFSAHYKDLKCFKCKMNSLVIVETTASYVGKASQALYIVIQFHSMFCANTIADTIWKACLKQWEISQKKLEDLLGVKLGLLEKQLE